MNIHRPGRLHRLSVAAAAAMATVVLLGTGSLTAAAPSGGAEPPAHAARGGGAPPKAMPTIVLVHGAFADSSGWQAVASRLLDKGFPVLAFSNPLRGPLQDAADLRDFLDTIEGPVVLVGHSYGGAVITNAATGDPDVTALVYVAAYAPAAGESVAAANNLGGGHAEVTDHLVLRPFPGASGGNADAYIDPAHFHRLFAQDLPRRTAAFMAASQRPGALAALVTPSGPPAWEEIPSWFLVATHDRIIPPEAERAMAQRAGSTTLEIRSSHVPMISHPARVMRLITDAAAG